MDQKYKIKADTIARTIILALALVNQILSATGHSVIPVQDSDIEVIVTTTFTVVMAVVNWWFNNSFTQAALRGDIVMDEIKASEKETNKK